MEEVGVKGVGRGHTCIDLVDAPSFWRKSESRGPEEN